MSKDSVGWDQWTLLWEWGKKEDCDDKILISDVKNLHPSLKLIDVFQRNKSRQIAEIIKERKR